MAIITNTNRKFGKFMEKALQSPDCGGQTLERFLDKTFSRLDYYASALKPILDTTPSGHPDFSLLQTSTERLSAITQEIARFKTILDHQKRITEATSCIEGLPEVCSILSSLPPQKQKNTTKEKKRYSQPFFFLL
jgi:hypothetical protein